MSVSIIQDTEDEGDREQFNLVLSGATTGVGISQGTAVVYIEDDDATPTSAPPDDGKYNIPVLTL